MSSYRSKNHCTVFASAAEDTVKRSSHRCTVYGRYDLDYISNFSRMSSTHARGVPAPVRTRNSLRTLHPPPVAAVHHLPAPDDNSGPPWSRTSLTGASKVAKPLRGSLPVCCLGGRMRQAYVPFDGSFAIMRLPLAAVGGALRMHELLSASKQVVCTLLPHRDRLSLPSGRSLLPRPSIFGSRRLEACTGDGLADGCRIARLGKRVRADIQPRHDLSREKCKGWHVLRTRIGDGQCTEVQAEGTTSSGNPSGWKPQECASRTGTRRVEARRRSSSNVPALTLSTSPKVVQNTPVTFFWSVV